MNNIRLTIAMFIIAAALAPALIFGLGTGSGTSDKQAVSASMPPIEPEVFKPAGLKQPPWLGAIKTRAQPVEATKPGPAATPAVATKPVAVVELFTSQGCSSCPPADRILAKIAGEVKDDPSVILLSFHVDYWDHLGWKDPFGSAQASERQRAYAKSFGERAVYTPQIVVGGGGAAGQGFVGSDEEKARTAIDAALKGSAPVARVTFGPFPGIKPGETARIDATVAATGDMKLPASTRVTIAIVEDGLSVQVKRGENEGRELSHERVVRVFAESAIDKDGRASAELAVPAGVKPERCRVVAIVQETGTPRILGAAQQVISVGK